MSSPHVVAPGNCVSGIMFKVLAALVPAIAAYAHFFGPAILINIGLASMTALAVEAAMLRARRYPLRFFLTDGSALLTAWLLALSIPPMAPWWLIVVGIVFAIAIGKHLYGGLGNNLFNPAMLGFAVLMISFPSHMTHWLTPSSLPHEAMDFGQILDFYFNQSLPAGMKLDAITTATPLDTLKTQLSLAHTVAEVWQNFPIFSAVSGKGTEIIAGLYLLGGLFMLQQRIITWHLPVAFLGTLFITAAVFQWADSARYASPMFHLFAGGAMLGGFFIVTDYVTGPTTPKGKLIFGCGAGFLEYVIRVLGGYPDGVAFSILIMNATVPLIDAYTQPRVFGHQTAGK